jgi:hypothetical protein
MSHLKSFTFTALPPIEVNPVIDRRTRMIARLEEQKLLLKDPGYLRSVKVWIEKDGERTLVEKNQRVLPWWRITPNGSVAFFIRVGQKPVEFEKGKAAISIASSDKLPGIIDTLIAAVRSGELDQQLAQASKAATVKKTR